MTRLSRSLLFFLAAAACWLCGGAPAAQAHGFNSVVYAQVDATGAHQLTVDLAMEYDLLVYSVDREQYTMNRARWDDTFFHRAYELAWKNPDHLTEARSDVEMAAALEGFVPAVRRYLAERFTITVGGQRCTAVMEPDVVVALKDPGYGAVPFAHVALDYTCPANDAAPVITSRIFPDAEQFVTGTKTLVDYDTTGLQDAGAGATGQMILDQDTRSGSTAQTDTRQFWEFFLTGFTHVLHGLDHILFLVALVAGSRRLREVVLCATAFTLAHAVTVSLVVLGAFTPSSVFVEPTIAFSIAAVAAWHLVRLGRHRGDADELGTGGGHFSLDRAGWLRVGIVFAFGLVHGMGFAGALNLDGRSGWNQLWSLISFNIGIEAVQLCLILAMFPVLAFLRRHSHLVWLYATGAIAVGVGAMGMVWFVGRVSGWYDISSDIG